MYVNLGCGSRFHPSWQNFDIAPAAPEVRRWDVSRRLPLAEASVEAVYHSHLLEHLRREDVGPFLKDCLRVLRSGGHLRVVVPDLEGAARSYLAQLEGALAGDEVARARYDWTVLELLDQTVRESSGGAMGDYLSGLVPDPDFVRARLGEEVDPWLGPDASSTPVPTRPAPPLSRRVRGRAARALTKAMPQVAPLRALTIGRFRLAGEVHQWMYDRLSLRRELEQAGFVDVDVVSATDSRIPEWAGFGLDARPDGRPRKPDSLFMEASKP